MAALKLADITLLSCVKCAYGVQKVYKTLIWLFNAITVHLTSLLLLRKAKKLTIDSNLKSMFSAIPSHVNHRLEQPYFVMNIINM